MRTPSTSPRRKPLLAVAAAALVLSASIVAPFFVTRGGSDVPWTHDMAQHVSVMAQFDSAFRSGALYPRWQADFNGGYGLPWLNYYPPGFYFLAEFFYLATDHWTRALLLLCVVLTAASGLAFYCLARTFLFSPLASAAGALFYVLTPYRVIDLYWRGALPELTGFLFVPVVLLFAYKAGALGRRRDIAALGLFHGLYLISHFPVAYLFTCALAFYAIAWTVQTRDVRVALRVGSGVALSLLVSAVYWLPALLERMYVREPFSQLFPYHLSYITLMPGGDVFNQAVNRTFAGVALALLASMLVLRFAPPAHPQTRLFTYLAMATLFMVTPYSSSIGRLIPSIEAVSFAWRWLLIVSCAVAMMLTAAADSALHRRKRALVAVVVAVIASHAWLTVRLIKPVLGNPTLDAPVGRNEEGFLPGGASSPQSLPNTENVVVLPPATAMRIERWAPLHREMDIRVESPSVVRLKTFTFPGWTARVDGKPTTIGSDSDGAQLVQVPAGAHRVEVTFENTRTRSAAMAVSAAGLLVVALMTALPARGTGGG